jgi:hypothetical protein
MFLNEKSLQNARNACGTRVIAGEKFSTICYTYFYRFFSPLTATVQSGYRSDIAETTATRIGVLDTTAAMSRHAQAERLFYRPCSPSMGDRAGGAARLAGAVAGTPTPALVAHPDWRRGGGYPPLRSNTMNTNQITVTVSKTCPPWAAYVSTTCKTVKVGNKFVTIEVAK